MPEETQEQPQESAQPQADEQEPVAEPQADEQSPVTEPETAETVEDEEGDGLPPNSVDVEEIGTLKKKVTVTIPRVRIDAKLSEMYGELNDTAQVPGFRIGRAPRRLIEKRFGKEVSSDVRNALIGESIGDAIEQADLKTLGEPDLELDDIEMPDSGDMAFSFEVEVSPEFELPETEGIKVERRSIEIDDARVDAMLDSWRQGQVRYEDTEDAAAEGDSVTGGAKITGEGLEEVDRPGLHLRVAPGQVEGLPLVDLAKELTGKKAGDTVTIKVTAPEAHPTEEWRGKELTIEIEISQVRRHVLPEITDEFAQQHGMDSVQELRAQVRRDLEGRITGETQRSMRDQVSQYLLDNTEFDLPEGVVIRHSARVLERRAMDMLMRGVPREQIDENLAELQAAASQEARRDLKLTFILTKIAEATGVQIGEEEVNSRIAEMARMYNRRPERLRQELAKDGRLEQLSVSLTEERVLNKLLEAAEVEDVDVTPAEDEGKTATKAKKTEKKAQKRSAKKTVEKKADEKEDE